MLHVWFKPNCSTCRTTLALIKENTKEKIELFEYLVESPTQKQIKEILKMLGMKASDLVRKKESLYKEKYEGKKLTQAQWISVLAKNPVLIERPIIVKDGKAVIGRPPEKILQLLH